MKHPFIAPIALIVLGITCLAFSLMVRHESIRLLTVPGLALVLVGGVLGRRTIRNRREVRAMNWVEVTNKYHVLTFDHDGELHSLPEEWQRELAALWRLEADVNNGAYLQFLENWDRESYVYASQALAKMGARRMASLIDRCQALVDEHIEWEALSEQDKKWLMPKTVINLQGEMVEGSGLLPQDVIERIYAWSYEFMAYPDDIAQLGMRYYGKRV